MIKLLLSTIFLISIQSIYSVCTNYYTTSESYSLSLSSNFNLDECVTFITTDTSYSNTWKITFNQVNIPFSSGDAIYVYDGDNINSNLLSVINFDINSQYIIHGNSSKAITIRTVTKFMISDDDTFKMSFYAQYGNSSFNTTLAVWIIIVIVFAILLVCCGCIYFFYNRLKNTAGITGYEFLYGAKSPPLLAPVPTQQYGQQVGYAPPNVQPYTGYTNQQVYVPQQNPYAPQQPYGINSMPQQGYQNNAAPQQGYASPTQPGYTQVGGYAQPQQPQPYIASQPSYAALPPQSSFEPMGGPQHQQAIYAPVASVTPVKDKVIYV